MQLDHLGVDLALRGLQRDVVVLPEREPLTQERLELGVGDAAGEGGERLLVVGSSWRRATRRSNRGGHGNLRVVGARLGVRGRSRLASTPPDTYRCIGGDRDQRRLERHPPQRRVSHPAAFELLFLPFPHLIADTGVNADTVHHVLPGLSRAG